MKLKIGTIAVTAILLLLSAVKVQAQGESNSEQILVRVYEMWSSNYYPSAIVISYGDEKTERVELKSPRQKNWEDNVDKINYVLKKIRKAGNELISSTSGGGETGLISTYVFVKKD